jgi:oxygen-independent coproporphyrinogen-3 oxidase
LRHPYLGFGVDAHSMLVSTEPEAVRLATSDDLDQFLAGAPRTLCPVDHAAAEDEAFFLGLRLNRGIDLRTIARQFSEDAIANRSVILDSLVQAGLLVFDDSQVRLTDRGRLLSNEVFERLILSDSQGEEAKHPRRDLINLQSERTQ